MNYPHQLTREKGTYLPRKHHTHGRVEPLVPTVFSPFSPKTPQTLTRRKCRDGLGGGRGVVGRDQGPKGGQVRLFLTDRHTERGVTLVGGLLCLAPTVISERPRGLVKGVEVCFLPPGSRSDFPLDRPDLKASSEIGNRRADTSSLFSDVERTRGLVSYKEGEVGTDYSGNLYCRHRL